MKNARRDIGAFSNEVKTGSREESATNRNKTRPEPRF
jgi:hypothetical protein